MAATNSRRGRQRGLSRGGVFVCVVGPDNKPVALVVHRVLVPSPARGHQDKADSGDADGMSGFPT